jgi:hypothetical protein
VKDITALRPRAAVRNVDPADRHASAWIDFKPWQISVTMRNAMASGTANLGHDWTPSRPWPSTLCDKYHGRARCATSLGYGIGARGKPWPWALTFKAHGSDRTPLRTACHNSLKDVGFRVPSSPQPKSGPRKELGKPARKRCRIQTAPATGSFRNQCSYLPTRSREAACCRRKVKKRPSEKTFPTAEPETLPAPRP